MEVPMSYWGKVSEQEYVFLYSILILVGRGKGGGGQPLPVVSLPGSLCYAVQTFAVCLLAV